MLFYNATYIAITSWKKVHIYLDGIESSILNFQFQMDLTFLVNYPAISEFFFALVSWSK
jgi:hypothetical protein